MENTEEKRYTRVSFAIPEEDLSVIEKYAEHKGIKVSEMFVSGALLKIEEEKRNSPL